MNMPQAGDLAPDFEILDDAGKTVRLSDYRGKTVVLYFYPQADTPGCTKQACTLRDSYHNFTQMDVAVLGASPDTVEAQAAFKAKFSLPFTLLADHDHALSEKYGLWGTHVVTYKGVDYTTHGTRRSTFIIGPDGMVTWSKFGVDAASNTAEILDILEGSPA